MKNGRMGLDGLLSLSLQPTMLPSSLLHPSLHPSIASSILMSRSFYYKMVTKIPPPPSQRNDVLSVFISAIFYHINSPERHFFMHFKPFCFRYGSAMLGLCSYRFNNQVSFNFTTQCCHWRTSAIRENNGRQRRTDVRTPSSRTNGCLFRGNCTVGSLRLNFLDCPPPPNLSVYTLSLLAPVQFNTFSQCSIITVSNMSLTPQLQYCSAICCNVRWW